MDINRLIAPDRVICLDQISSKKRLLETLGQMLSLGAIDLDPAEIFNKLIERERLGSTGLGHGVALPHGRLGNNTSTVGAFIKLNTPVDFDSTDGKPTDLIFALLVPIEHTEEHLQILASLAGMFSDGEFCKQLRECNTDEDLFKLLSGWSTASIAS